MPVIWVLAMFAVVSALRDMGVTRVCVAGQDTLFGRVPVTRNATSSAPTCGRRRQSAPCRVARLIHHPASAYCSTTMHIGPTLDYLERAFDDAKYGEPSREPMLECTMATALDDTLAPPGKHILSMFVQYAPYHLKDSTWDVEKDKFADRFRKQLSAAFQR